MIRCRDFQNDSQTAFARAALLLLGVAMLVTSPMACSKATDPDAPTRTYRMGFSALSPRLTIEDVIATLEKWEPRGDAAVMLLTPQWKALLADTSPSLIINREYKQLVDRYRAEGFVVVIMMDATNGFDRSKEDAELVSLGRSIGEPAVRALYKEWAIALDTILHPNYLGIAMETNLIRFAAPPAVYANVKTLANETAAALNARGTSARLFVSVQVEVAWGKLVENGTYAGIAQDRADFPFMEALGLSSYPNLTTVDVPEELPLDYYSRLVTGSELPMLVVEGGWATTTSSGNSSPALQARYIQRHLAIADRAQLAALFQLTFTDIDLDSFGGELGMQLTPFATLGLVTENYLDKPALAEWDRGFARPLRPLPEDR